MSSRKEETKKRFRENDLHDGQIKKEKSGIRIKEKLQVWKGVNYVILFCSLKYCLNVFIALFEWY